MAKTVVVLSLNSTIFPVPDWVTVRTVLAAVDAVSILYKGSVDTIYAGGIYCFDCNYASIVNNTISDFDGNGIYLWCGEHTTVSGNAVYEAHYHGIYIEGNNGGDADYNTIISNTIRNSSQKADNTYSDIYLSDNGVHYATHNIISGNTIYASASNKSKYGIAEKSSSDDYNIITNNIISGPYTDISIQGPHTTLSGNKTSDSTEPLYNIETASTAASTALTITQSGTGDIVNLYDGSNKVFQVADGGNITAWRNATLTGGNLTIGPLSPPSNLSVATSSSSGSCATGTTYYYRVTAVNPNGETLGCTEVSTSTTDTSDKKEGTASVKFEIDDAFTTGTIAYHTISSIDISEYSNIKYWIKTSSSKNYGVFKLILDDTSDCSSPLKEIDLPETRTFWENHYLNLGDTSGLTNITCVGIKAVSDPGAITIRIDDIKASKGPILIQKCLLKKWYGRQWCR